MPGPAPPRPAPSPSQVGKGLFHRPSFPHTSVKLPLSCFPGSSQLNVRKRSGSMGASSSGKPITVTLPPAGGGSQLKAGEAGGEKKRLM